jgi:hypothetical protein
MFPIPYQNHDLPDLRSPAIGPWAHGGSMLAFIMSLASNNHVGVDGRNRIIRYTAWAAWMRCLVAMRRYGPDLQGQESRN